MRQIDQNYRHVVLFKFHDKTKDETVVEIEAAFQALAKKLPFVIDFEWGRNSSPEKLDQGFTHCFIVSFKTDADRDLYLPHPDHLAFCKTYLDPHLEKVCVVDFLTSKGR